MRLTRQAGDTGTTSVSGPGQKNRARNIGLIIECALLARRIQIRHVGDERIECRAPLRLVNRGDRAVRGRIGRKAVHSLGRDRDKAAFSQRLSSRGDCLRRRSRKAGFEIRVAHRSPSRRVDAGHGLGNPIAIAEQDGGANTARPRRRPRKLMPYRSPSADILFSLQTVAELPRLIETELEGELDWETIASVIGEAGRFATDEIAPLNRPGDLVGAQWKDSVVTTPPGFADVYRRWAEAGWGGVSASAEYGGMGLPHLVDVACTEIWNGANMAFALCPLLTEGAVGALKSYGSQALLDRYLPNMIAGRWTGAMNLTEPQAGSDLNAVKTRAQRADDGTYRLFGQKIYITYGEHDMAENIVHLVLARLPDAPPGTRGLSLFLAPKFLVNDDGSLGARNDLRCGSIEHKLGIHGSPTCVMLFGEGEGAKAWLVGEENHGLAAMFVMMNAARLAVGTQGVAIGERAYQQALEFARDRRQGRGAAGGPEMAPILSHPDVQRMLMTMKATTQAARGICHLTAASLAWPHPGSARQGREPRRASNSDRESFLNRPRRRGGVAWRSGARRHGLHRGDGRGAAHARLAYRRHL